MQHLTDLDAVQQMTDLEIIALEDFMRFACEHQLSDPREIDVDAYVALNDVSSDSASTLARAMSQLGLGVDFVDAISKSGRNRDLARTNTRLKGNHQRTYKKTVSVPLEEFPDSWRATIVELRLRCAYSPSILTRMTQRLGMFIFSARTAGLTHDLNNAFAERALYDDMLERSEARNAGGARYAYLRTTAEELLRFATAHGEAADTLQRFKTSRDSWQKLETKQSPLKMAKVTTIPSAAQVIALATQGLAEAHNIEHPTLRHQDRLKWCAIGIFAACGPRAEDVATKLRWGDGVFFDERTKKYKFDYITSKNAKHLIIPFEKFWSPFFEALLLGDIDRRYLKHVREKAILTQQPLLLKENGEPVAYGWIGRAWDSLLGTGSHIARTQIYDELAATGELGIKYGQAVMHHSDQVVSRYRSSNAKRASIAEAQNVLERRASKAGSDDISDLI